MRLKCRPISHIHYLTSAIGVRYTNIQRRVYKDMLPYNRGVGKCYFNTQIKHNQHQIQKKEKLKLM